MVQPSCLLSTWVKGPWFNSDPCCNTAGRSRQSLLSGLSLCCPPCLLSSLSLQCPVCLSIVLSVTLLSCLSLFCPVCLSIVLPVSVLSCLSLYCPVCLSIVLSTKGHSKMSVCSQIQGKKSRREGLFVWLLSCGKISYAPFTSIFRYPLGPLFENVSLSIFFS